MLKVFSVTFIINMKNMTLLSVEESCPNTVTVMGTEEANEFTKQ